MLLIALSFSLKSASRFIPKNISGKFGKPKVFCFMKKLFFCICLIAILLVANSKAYCQVPDFSKVPNVHAGDSLNITSLLNNGVKVNSDKVICWFPKDSLSQERMDEIVALISKGVDATEKYLKAPLVWQVHPFLEPYTFYFRNDRFVSHGSLAGFVSIPFWRIKENKAPWLHEALHEMLYSKSEDLVYRSISDSEFYKIIPLWLFEGLPEYISTEVLKLQKVDAFDVFSNSYNSNYDSLFVKEVQGENGKYVLSFIGNRGVIPELFTEKRSSYAPTFYHGSASFVKYLVSHYSLELLLSAISSFRKEHEVIEKACGKPIETLKKEWLTSLRIVN